MHSSRPPACPAPAHTPRGQRHSPSLNSASADDEGNLNWLAACEVEPATYAMGIRTFKAEPTLTPQVRYPCLKEACRAHQPGQA